MVAADLNGKWTGTIETNGSRVPVYLTLNQQDGKVTGSIATGNNAKQVPVEKPQLDGDTLTFEVHDNADRMVKFRLSLRNDALIGESTVGGQTSNVSLSAPRRGGVVAVDGLVVSGGGSGDRAPSGGGVASGQGVRDGVYRASRWMRRPSKP